MSRLFYIHDIQDIWLFGVPTSPLLTQGSTLVYNTRSGKCTAPHKFLKYLTDFNLVPFSEINQDFNALIDQSDQFITKEGLPFSADYLSSNPSVRKRNKTKLISLGWIGESATTSTPYYGAVKNNCKLHFCVPQLVPVYQALGFKNVSGQEPKFVALNSLCRESGCSILNLDPSQKYATFIISSGGGLARKGLLKNLYSSSNQQLVHSIYEYCADNNIKIILKSKLKHQKNKEGLKGDISLEGNNIFYHQSLLLMNISEFTVGFGSSAALESEVIEAPYVNFLPSPRYSDTNKPYENWLNPSPQRPAVSSHLAQSSNVFNISPDDSLRPNRASLISFIDNASAPNFQKKHILHPVFK